MTRSKYEAGKIYSNGDLTLKFRYDTDKHMHFSVDGERRKMHKTLFYKLKLKLVS